MAVIDNTVLTSDVAAGLDIEFLTRLNGDINDLQRVLGIVTPEVMAAGTALYKVTVTGELNEDERAEGDEVPLSKYGTSKEPIDALAPKPYRKLTTGEAILKSGVTNAVLREDDKMIKDIRNGIVSDFFAAITPASATANGASLQAALAQVDAKLQDALETNHDSAGRLVHFVNPFDIADYLGAASISTQTAFGMTYLESFLGVQNVLVTNRVAAKSVIVTPSENLHLYGIDFSALTAGGLPYTTIEGGLVGVNHETAYDRFGVITNAATGVKVMAEVTNYIIKGSITPGA